MPDVIDRHHTPTVSIITPAHNAAPFIHAAVDSVLDQTLADWELIVVDDGSRDGTSAILDTLTDPRIRVIHQAKAGVSAARNVGLAAARGRYLTFLDADDRLPPRALEIRAAFLDAHPEIDIVNGAISITSAGSDVRRYRPSCRPGPLFPPLARLQEDVFFGAFYMARRDGIGSHRFPVGLTHCEDLIFFLRLAHDADLNYGAVEEDVYEYRLRPGSAMTNIDGLERGYVALLQHAALLPRLDAKTRRHMKRRISSILIKSWLRRGSLLRALAVPGKIFRA